MVVGKSVKRVDAFDKVTGRAKYTDDLADKSALIVKIYHSTIATAWSSRSTPAPPRKFPAWSRC